MKRIKLVYPAVMASFLLANFPAHAQLKIGDVLKKVTGSGTATTGKPSTLEIASG